MEKAFRLSLPILWAYLFLGFLSRTYGKGGSFQCQRIFGIRDNAHSPNAQQACQRVRM